METVKKRHWFFIYLQSLLIGELVDSSSLSSAARPLSITTEVGEQVVLPCSWKSRLGDVAPPTCHIEWTDHVDKVFEQRGELRWQAPELEGRAEVREEKLKSGDCSLIIRDVQIGDTGLYESFMVVDGARSRRTRMFIQSVKLSVFEHKTLRTLVHGEDLVLDLYTRHSMRVVFLGRNSSEWLDLWMREDNDTEHVEKHPWKEQLTIKKLRRSDEGLYKVLDGQGLSVSTVQLSVDEKVGASAERRVQEGPTSAASAAQSERSAVPLLLLLLLSLTSTLGC